MRLISESREPSVKPTLLVLLHGLGSNEEDLFAFAPELDPRITVVCLRAPRQYGYGGYAWFDVGWTESGISFSNQQALESLDILERDLADIQRELGLEASRTIIGGFSQGAMMSLGILLRKPDLVGGAILLSGSLIPDFAVPGEGVRKPVFQSHGLNDPVLPIELGRSVRDLLIQREAVLDYHEYAMAHEVNLECLLDLKEWTQQFLDN